MSTSPLLIYLAGPQDDVSTRTARRWREEIAALAPAGVAFFSPAHAYLNVNDASFQGVDRMNRAAIVNSHAMIANLAGKGRGFGTIREIEYAIASNTPVWAVGDIGHSLMTHDLSLFSTVEECLVDILERVDAVRQQLSRSPWGMFMRPFGEQEL